MIPYHVLPLSILFEEAVLKTGLITHLLALLSPDETVCVQLQKEAIVMLGYFAFMGFETRRVLRASNASALPGEIEIYGVLVELLRSS